MPEVACRHGPQITCNLHIDAGGLFEAAALHEPHGGVNNGFSGQPMDSSRFEPENVTRQMECADLTPSVGKQLVGANRTADHLVDIFRGIILAVDFLVLPVGELGGYQARMSGQRIKVIRDRAGNRADLVDDNGGVERRGEHGPSPLRRWPIPTWIRQARKFRAIAEGVLPTWGPGGQL